MPPRSGAAFGSAAPLVPRGLLPRGLVVRVVPTRLARHEPWPLDHRQLAAVGEPHPPQARIQHVLEVVELPRVGVLALLERLVPLLVKRDVVTQSRRLVAL